MKEDFSELIEYLDVKFTKVDERFNKVDERFEKTATKEDVLNLTSKVIELEVGFADLTGRITKLEESVHALTSAIDKLAKAVDDLRVEYSSVSMKSDRHEKWILQLAEKLGLKLDY